MMKFLRTNTFRTFIVLLFSAAVFALSVDPALAATSSDAGKSIAQLLKEGAATPVLVAAALVLFFIEKVITLLLTFSAYLFSNAFHYNIQLVPAQMDVVLIGWTIMRDIANALFILIILWVALTIIFNLEGGGGRKLLTRVIVFALLINFSLAFVSVGFAFTNQIAKTFADKIQISEGDVAQFILDKTKLHTKDKVLSPDVEDAIKKSVEPTAVPTGATDGLFTRNPLKDTLLASVGIRQANAGFVSTGLCGVGGVLGGIFGFGIGSAPAAIGGCVAGSLVGGLIEAIFNLRNGLFEYALQSVIQSSMASVLMLILASAMIYASIALIMRIAWIILLSILAPAAFLIAASPVGKQWFSWWIKQLTTWMFFAPIFYFIYYLIFFMLNMSNSILNANTNATIDPSRVAQLAVIATLMMVGVSFAKKAGGQTANFVVGWGKSLAGFGLGVATGGLAFGARRAFTGVAANVAEGKGRLGILSKVPGVAMGAARFAAQDKREIENLEKQYEHFSVDELKTQANARGVTPRKRAAMVSVLAKRNRLDAAKLDPGKIQSAVTLLNSRNIDAKSIQRQYGAGDAEEQKKALERIGVQDVESLHEGFFRAGSDTDSKDVREELYKNFGAGHLRKLAERSDNTLEQFLTIARNDCRRDRTSMGMTDTPSRTEFVSWLKAKNPKLAAWATSMDGEDQLDAHGF